MSNIDKEIVSLVFAKLRNKSKTRATSLRQEAKGYWHINRERYHELRARAVRFDDFASLMDEITNDPIAYPSNGPDDALES